MTLDPLPVVAESLQRQSGSPWVVVGGAVHGPGTTAVVAAEHGERGDVAHIDLGFVLQRNDPNVPVIWDCATGWGSTEQEALQQAVTSWSTTTAATVLELLQQDGSFAHHYTAESPDGFAGWHSIHGPILGWGAGDGPQLLQEWWLEHPVLPHLTAPIRRVLERPSLNGVRMFLGSQGRVATAEVRLNGAVIPEAGEALLNLDWPRFDRPAYARAFALLVHDESSTGLDD